LFLLLSLIDSGARWRQTALVCTDFHFTKVLWKGYKNIFVAARRAPSTCQWFPSPKKSLWRGASGNVQNSRKNYQFSSEMEIGPVGLPVGSIFLERPVRLVKKRSKLLFFAIFLVENYPVLVLNFSGFCLRLNECFTLAFTSKLYLLQASLYKIFCQKELIRPVDTVNHAFRCRSLLV